MISIAEDASHSKDEPRDCKCSCHDRAHDQRRTEMLTTTKPKQGECRTKVSCPFNESKNGLASEWTHRSCGQTPDKCPTMYQRTRVHEQTHQTNDDVQKTNHWHQNTTTRNTAEKEKLREKLPRRFLAHTNHTQIRKP